MSEKQEHKYKVLWQSVVFDAIGMVSYALPFIGEFSDIFWAPMAGWLMTRMYKGKVGQAAGFITFVEEFVPGLDILPTFTLMWWYTYVFKGGRKKTIIQTD